VSRARHRYFHVDVFGEAKYSGNPLAVVLPSAPMQATGMQAIAREFNFPETTFVTSLKPKGKGGGYDVRIFTPQREVPFAGHPTLGTAYVIRRLLAESAASKSGAAKARAGKPGGAENRPGEIVLNLKIGPIPVRFPDGDSGVLWMRQKAPEFGPIHARTDVAGILGLASKDIDARFPVQEVSTGMRFLMIPLKDLDAVKRARTDPDAYRAHFRKGEGEGLPLFLFSPETYAPGNRINCRMFADVFGIPEDPATGSANGCLAGYLARHRYFGSDAVDITVEQGYEMGRRSRLHLSARTAAKGIEVDVGGRVFPVAEGRLL
jgi:trans-2,3-dihydro-3-hydroxyanthranilate isomerase